MNNRTKIVEAALEGIVSLRRKPAKVHAITNTVAQNFTANVLLACGAIPSMTVNPDEVEAFTVHAEALHINLGTLDKDRMEAIRRSGAVAVKNRLPVLLDPVMAHVSPIRCEFAQDLMTLPPSIVRANAPEAEALAIKSDFSGCLIITGPGPG